MLLSLFLLATSAYGLNVATNSDIPNADLTNYN
jgi:hypothetical protein